MVGCRVWVLLSLHKKSSLRQIIKIRFDNVTHSSKYSKQDENPIRNQSLTLLRFKCEAVCPQAIVCPQASWATRWCYQKTWRPEKQGCYCVTATMPFFASLMCFPAVIGCSNCVYEIYVVHRVEIPFRKKVMRRGFLHISLSVYLQFPFEFSTLSHCLIWMKLAT